MGMPVDADDPAMVALVTRLAMANPRSERLCQLSHQLYMHDAAQRLTAAQRESVRQVVYALGVSEHVVDRTPHLSRSRDDTVAALVAAAQAILGGGDGAPPVSVETPDRAPAVIAVRSMLGE